jgi:hypothetical protein
MNAKSLTPNKLHIAASIAVSSVLLFSLFAPAVTPVFAGSDNNVGKHAYKVNIIGRPNTWNGDDTGSNSKTLFISIKEQQSKVTCEDDSGVTLTGTETWTPENGQRIYFYSNTENTFDVEDRDATDGQAIVSIPQTENGFDIFVRILGGSNKNFPGCLDADAYQYILTNDTGTLYYYIGHLDANRKPGQPEKVNVRSLFYDGNTAYFDNIWSDYFWTIQNNGLRNMQLIFYETSPA